MKTSSLRWLACALAGMLVAFVASRLKFNVPLKASVEPPGDAVSIGAANRMVRLPSCAEREPSAKLVARTIQAAKQPNLLVIWGDEIGLHNIGRVMNGEIAVPDVRVGFGGSMPQMMVGPAADR